MTAPSPTFIKVQSRQVAEIIAGEPDGIPILMLHGWGANRELIWPLAERLLRLHYRVYVPDLPGFGQSPAPDVAWSVFDYANFVMNYLDSQHLDRVHFFGHSFGGRLGLILGAEHPERIHKMILADSAGIRPQPSKTSQIRLKTYKSIRGGLQKIGLNTLSGQLSDWYNRRYGSADFQAASGVMRETFVKVVNQDLLSYAARVRPSTLLLWGDQDKDTPLEQGQLLEKTIPDAGLVVLKGAGHYSYLDQVGDCVRIIDHFLRH